MYVRPQVVLFSVEEENEIKGAILVYVLVSNSQISFRLLFEGFAIRVTLEMDYKHVVPDDSHERN